MDKNPALKVASKVFGLTPHVSYTFGILVQKDFTPLTRCNGSGDLGKGSKPSGVNKLPTNLLQLSVHRYVLATPCLQRLASLGFSQTP